MEYGMQNYIEYHTKIQSILCRATKPAMSQEINKSSYFQLKTAFKSVAFVLKLFKLLTETLSLQLGFVVLSYLNDTSTFVKVFASSCDSCC